MPSLPPRYVAALLQTEARQRVYMSCMTFPEAYCHLRSLLLRSIVSHPYVAFLAASNRRK